MKGDQSNEGRFPVKLLLLVLAIVVFVSLAPIRLWFLTSLTTLGDRDTRLWAIKALGRLGPEAIPALRGALYDERFDVRLAAVEVLAECGPGACRALPDVFANFESPAHDSLNFHDFAVDHLRTEYPELVLEELLAILANPESTPRLRIHACHWLGLLDVPVSRVLPPLIAILKDPKASPQLRTQACCSVGQLGHKARPALPLVLKHGRTADRKGTLVVLEAVREIECFNKDVEAWLLSLKSHPDPDARSQAEDILEILQPDQDPLRSGD